MSDAKSEAPASSEDVKSDLENKRKRLDSVDWFLTNLVNLANDAGVGIGITLNVGGTIISGTLVSGADYFKGFADQMASAFQDKEVSESIRKSYSEYADLYPKRKLDENGDDVGGERETPTPSYIHLQNAKFFANGQATIPGEDGLWWRGRLSAVDGFSLGGLSTS